jgi:hypothetical protein
MRFPTRDSVVLAAVAIAVAGCAAQSGSTPTGAAPSDEERPIVTAPDLATVPPGGDPVTGEVPEAILASVVADAAERAGVEPEDVEVVQAMAVTWSDGSLDCPEPGMLYTQALVDGYHVILAADADEFDYRVTSQGGFRLCEGGGRPSG